jgi:hypothetical protein
MEHTKYPGDLMQFQRNTNQQVEMHVLHTWILQAKRVEMHDSMDLQIH